MLDYIEEILKNMLFFVFNNRLIFLIHFDFFLSAINLQFLNDFTILFLRD